MQIDFLPDIFTDEYINNLLVDVNTFADISCIGARTFGVHTECDECDYDIPLCVRKHLVDNLFKAQNIVERTVGYPLTPRYHTEEILWDPKWPVGVGQVVRFQTQWPGIESLNVTLQRTAIAELEEVPVEFIVQTAVPLTSGGTYCIAELDADLVDNPANVTLMDANGKVYPQDKRSGFPRINGSGNWEVAIDRSSDPATCPELINAYHCRLVYADVTAPLPTCTGEIIPVYPDTEQKIPVVKKETLDSGDVRYWFNIWELVKPAFQDEIVNISSGEYYKLFQTISFLCEAEVEALPVITCHDGCTCSGETTYSGCLLTIRDAEYGIVDLCCDTSPCNCLCSSSPKKISISYKTNPSVLDLHPSLAEAIDAIVHWAAANLPLKSCDCQITKGFIATAQEAYTEIRMNPISGEKIQNFKHGNLYGQLVFAERLGSLPVYRRLLTV